MEIIEKKTESIERSSLQLEKRIKEVERLGDDTSALWKQLSELQEYINISKEDLQSIRTYYCSTRHLPSNTKSQFLCIPAQHSMAIFQILLLILLVIGCILLNHSRGLKKFSYKLDAVLLHLKMTG